MLDLFGNETRLAGEIFTGESGLAVPPEEYQFWRDDYRLEFTREFHAEGAYDVVSIETGCKRAYITYDMMFDAVNPYGLLIYKPSMAVNCHPTLNLCMEIVMQQCKYGNWKTAEELFGRADWRWETIRDREYFVFTGT